MTGAALRHRDPFLAMIVERLVRQLRPRQIYLFGSRARGNARPDSDYDVLVVAESELTGYKRMVVARRAVGFVGGGCDIFVYTPQEFDKHRAMLGDVARTAAEQGVVLYDEAA